MRERTLRPRVSTHWNSASSGVAHATCAARRVRPLAAAPAPGTSARAQAAPGAESGGPLRRAQEVAPRQKRLATEHEVAADEGQTHAVPHPAPDLRPGVEAECQEDFRHEELAGRMPVNGPSCRAQAPRRRPTLTKKRRKPSSGAASGARHPDPGRPSSRCGFCLVYGFPKRCSPGPACSGNTGNFPQALAWVQDSEYNTKL